MRLVIQYLTFILFLGTPVAVVGNITVDREMSETFVAEDFEIKEDRFSGNWRTPSLGRGPFATGIMPTV